jgi:4-carboxymuconolactone decarboxylase
VSRVENLKVEDLSPEQQKVYAQVAGTRSGVNGPFPIWLRRPEIAQPAEILGTALRVAGKLDRRLFELMVLIIARYWSAQYEWSVHEKHALNVGISPETIAAIKVRRPPAFTRADEQAVYDLVTELNETKRVSAPTYERALRELGLDLLIELVSGAGFYTMVAMMLDVFEVEPRDGRRRLD